jgi:hypothetical protein
MVDALVREFVGVLSFNVGAALVAYGIVYYTRRKELRMTWGRGLSVLGLGWVFGSVLAELFYSLFILSGVNVEGSLQLIVAVVLISSVMYPLFTWLCLERDKPT